MKCRMWPESETKYGHFAEPQPPLTGNRQGWRLIKYTDNRLFYLRFKSHTLMKSGKKDRGK